MKDTIGFNDYFIILKKRKKIIVSIILLFIILSAIINYKVIKPKYESNTTLIVNGINTGKGNDMTSDDMGVTRDLAVVYSEIIKSRTVLEEVINNLKLNISYEEIKDMVEVETINDTQIINIVVQNSDPVIAKNIANSIPRVFASEANRIFNINSVEVIDKAIKPELPIKPNKMINMAIATILSVFVGIFTSFLLEYMDTKIIDPEEVELILDIPILGVLPDEKI